MTVYCDTCDESSAAIDPLRDFRDYHVIFLANVDGVLWASNSYWAVPVPDASHRIARLFHAYNLALEPGTYLISDTLTRKEPADIKDIKELVLSKVPEGLKEISPVRFNGADVFVRGTDDQWLAVFDIPGGIAVVDDERRRLAEAMAPEGKWFAGPNPNEMFVRQTEDSETADGRITAVLMPMRHKASDAKS